MLDNAPHIFCTQVILNTAKKISQKGRFELDGKYRALGGSEALFSLCRLMTSFKMEMNTDTLQSVGHGLRCGKDLYHN